MRLMLDACGRILGRRDLKLVEERAAQYCLIATRTTPAERQAIGRMQDSSEALSRRFLTVSTAPDIIAFVECLEVEMRDFV